LISFQIVGASGSPLLLNQSARYGRLLLQLSAGRGPQVTYIAVGATTARADSRAIYLTLLSLAAAYFLAFPIWRATFRGRKG